MYFWTGRGFHGYGTIGRITDERIFLNPEPDAHKGSDFRVLVSGEEWWMPRNIGVLRDQIDTLPKFWYRNF